MSINRNDVSHLVQQTDGQSDSAEQNPTLTQGMFVGSVSDNIRPAID